MSPIEILASFGHTAKEIQTFGMWKSVFECIDCSSHFAVKDDWEQIFYIDYVQKQAFIYYSLEFVKARTPTSCKDILIREIIK